MIITIGPETGIKTYIYVPSVRTVHHAFDRKSEIVTSIQDEHEGKTM